MRTLTTPQILLGVILLCGLALRLHGISYATYNPDELMHVAMARGETFAELWRRSVQEAHPPLGHFLRFFTLRLGDGLLSERLISALLGTLTIPMFYLIGREVGGKAGGLLLAFICMSAPMTIEASQQVRNYALFLLLLSGGVYHYLRYAATAQRRNLLWFSVLMTLACATHFSGFVAAIILGLDATWRCWRRGELRRLIPVILAYVPMGILGLFAQHFFFAVGTAGYGWKMHYISLGKLYQHSVADIVQQVFMLLDVWLMFVRVNAGLALKAMGVEIWFLCSLLCICVAHGFAWRQAWRARSPHLMLSILFVIVAGVMAYLQLYPIVATRHMLYSYPFLLLPFAIAMQPYAARVERCNPWPFAAAIMLVVALHSAATVQRWHTKKFELSRASYAAMLADVATLDDAPILSNRFTTLYIDHAIDGNRVGYDALDPLRTRVLDGHRFITDARQYYWAFTPEHFRALAGRVLAAYPTEPRIGFLVLRVYGWDLLPFYRCLAKRGEILSTREWDREILYFSIARATLEKEAAASPTACSNRVTLQ